MSMAACGIPRETIARIMGISAQVLRAQFEDELLKGAILANYAVAKSLFEMATRDRNPTAAIFWAKARMGWRDRGPSFTAGSTRPVHPQGDVAADLSSVVARLSEDGRRAWMLVTAELSPKPRRRSSQGVEGAKRARPLASKVQNNG